MFKRLRVDVCDDKNHIISTGCLRKIEDIF